jgi:hypothetical protein
MATQMATGRVDARFGGYPYLLSRIGQGGLVHIALLPSDWSRQRAIEAARTQADANRFETAVCFGRGDAVFVAFDNTRIEPGKTPAGIYAYERLLLAEPLAQTDDLAHRRAWLHAFDRATRVDGYMVGDGTSRGESARLEDRLRLGERGPDGLPAGLRRCARCGQAAGDYLRGGIEIVRVYCACENHNRCARCRTPLAEHRLSAWYWDDDDDQAWHLAAYAAFAHRCPEEQERADAGAQGFDRD